jgi:enoyl-CoA hydratase
MNCFTLEHHDHIAHLVLNRPEAMNTMNPQFWRELDDTLTQLHRQGTARALVISSTGKHFSAGMALETFGGAITMDDASPEGRAAVAGHAGEPCRPRSPNSRSLRIPVLAAIHGGCIGGAVDMVTACCMRYATQDAFFCIQEINIGMVADVGTLQRLPKLIPRGRGQGAGLHRPPPSRCPGAWHWDWSTRCSTRTRRCWPACHADAPARSPPSRLIAIWGTKQAIHYTRDHSVADSLATDGLAARRHLEQRAMSCEAVTAMKEKRAGNFPDLATLQRFEDMGR